MLCCGHAPPLARRSFVLVNQRLRGKSASVPRQFPELSMTGFADAMRPDKFTGVSFKRWEVKCQLWLMTLKIFHVSKGMPEGTISE